ncbi:laccase-3 [Canna indica]|uniref:laccase n=1 Tax=Canna indica TaxID=4628 RepID=A0AAQ3KGD2_9LILI|nr:laccase-3 [Canna indica]
MCPVVFCIPSILNQLNWSCTSTVRHNARYTGGHLLSCFVLDCLVDVELRTFFAATVVFSLHFDASEDQCLKMDAGHLIYSLEDHLLATVNWSMEHIPCYCYQKMVAEQCKLLLEAAVQAMPVKRLCRTHNIITVNGQYPGPTLMVRNGDTLIINVVNKAKYNITLHWHGIRQLRTGWADGPEFVTQCPIRPGEWWNKDPVEVVRQAAKTGVVPNVSDAFTINGQPGDLYQCSSKETTVFRVKHGETNLLRFINAAVNHELFISVAGHTMTVVAADACYTKPFTTSFLMLAPGQTTDVLLTADHPARGRYYLAAHAFSSGQGVPFDNTTTTAVLEYEHSSDCPQPQAAPPPPFPLLPPFNDTTAAATFGARFRSPSPVELPGPADHHLFVTVGLGRLNCAPGQSCSNGTRLAASMNNVSFQFPTRLSMLQANYFRVPGVFTADFPAAPPVRFDYTGNNISQALWWPAKGTKVFPLKYGAVVEIVMQGTDIIVGEEHPMHLHGYHFYVLATGKGNFDPARDAARFNLVDPPMRNTVGVPRSGWAAVRFVADNPGVWLVHCHLDVHIGWGLAMAFLVENGVGPLQSLEPPPPDLPQC